MGRGDAQLSSPLQAPHLSSEYFRVFTDLSLNHIFFSGEGFLTFSNRLLKGTEHFFSAYLGYKIRRLKK